MDRSSILKRAHDLRREYAYTMDTAQRLAWAEAKGLKRYAVHLEDIRHDVITYMMKLADEIEAATVYDIHAVNKYMCISSALDVHADRAGVVVVEGKVAGLLKYAARHGAAA